MNPIFILTLTSLTILLHVQQTSSLWTMSPHGMNHPIFKGYKLSASRPPEHGSAAAGNGIAHRTIQSYRIGPLGYPYGQRFRAYSKGITFNFCHFVVHHNACAIYWVHFFSSLERRLFSYCSSSAWCKQFMRQLLKMRPENRMGALFHSSNPVKM